MASCFFAKSSCFFTLKRDILRVAFCANTLSAKIAKPNCKLIKAGEKNNFTQKAACKMLVPGGQTFLLEGPK